MARRTKDATGRVTPKGTRPAGAKGPAGRKAGASDDDRPRYAREATGRYTAPTPPEAVAPSPKWVPVLMLVLFAGGLLMIIINYLGVVLPGAPSNWYLLGGLIAIIAGFVVSTRWH
jgi:hypothetical protein